MKNLNDIHKTPEQLQASATDKTTEAVNVAHETLKRIEQKEFPTKMKVELEGAELLTIKGEVGEKGEIGLTGERGEIGPQGLRGPTGEKGVKGDRGEVGSIGPVGPVGLKGKDGKDGSPDTGEQIIEKISPIKNALDFTILKNVPDFLTSRELGQGGTGGGGGPTILFQDDGTTITQSPITKLNVTGSGGSITYSGNGVATLDLTGGGGGAGHTIQEEGSDLTARTYLNFIGETITAADDAGNDATTVTVDDDLSNYDNTTSLFFDTAGEGLDSASTTVSLDVSGLSADTIASADLLVFYDDSGTHHNVISYEDFVNSLGIPSSTETRIVSGCQLIYDTGLTFIVTSGTYLIQGVLYSSAQQSITLDDADVTNDRIDAITLDTSGTVGKVTGTPAANPSKPSVDPTLFVEVGFVLVPAGATSLQETTEDVYLENAGQSTEWDGTDGSGGDVDFAATADPRTGTFHVDADLTSADYFEFEGASAIDTSQYSALTFFMKLTEWTGNRLLFARFYNQGVQKGTFVLVNSSVGLDVNDFSNYQGVSIPVFEMNIPPGETIDQVRFTCEGTSGSPSSNIHFYVDDMQFRSGAIVITTSSNVNSLDEAYDGGIGSGGGGRTITADSGAVEITVPDDSNNVGLQINQNDSTNNPATLGLTNAGTGAHIISTGTNEDLILSPNGTGVIVIGTGSASGTLESNGNQDLILQTGNATTGTITITDGADGDINIAPNGTGEVQAGGNRVLDITDAYIKAITIEDPTDSEDLTMFFTDYAITVTQMNAVLLGSSTPSVTWTIRHGTDRSATGAEVVTSGTTTTSTTTGSEVTSFNDATIPASSWVWVETTAQSGTLDEINITIKFTRD